jgi:hypothetical protein
LDDEATARAALLAQCVDWSIGPLTVRACLDLQGPSVSVKATLLGVELADCTLSLAQQNCTVGGAIDGFKAEVDLTLTTSPLQLIITATLCTPFTGCETFTEKISF